MLFLHNDAVPARKYTKSHHRPAICPPYSHLNADAKKYITWEIELRLQDLLCPFNRLDVSINLCPHRTKPVQFLLYSLTPTSFIQRFSTNYTIWAHRLSRALAPLFILLVIYWSRSGLEDCPDSVRLRMAPFHMIGDIVLSMEGFDVALARSDGA